MPNRLHEGRVLQGFFWGALVGAAVALFYLPRLNVTRLTEQAKETITHDPVDEGIAEGKAVAQQRLDEIRRRLTAGS